MNGYDWHLWGECSTCGSREEVTAPFEHVAGKLGAWLREHDRHEFKLRQSVVRPAEATEAELMPPDWERVVPIRDRAAP